ncbi:MAG: acetyl-CoA hydrolase/transferase family protein [Firmicutes bacterium]|nr:acetyl-CoA hydrolase/transferase family protein [Bacillota bacterium]
MGVYQEYEQKKVTVDQCLEKIQSGDRIFLGFYGGEPRTILRKMHTIGPRVTDVEVWKATDMEDFPVFMMPEMEGHIEMKSIFYGKTARGLSKIRPVDYFPNDLHSCMRLKNEQEPCNIFMVTVAPMDEEGNFTLGSWVQIEQDALEAAETVIVEVNPNAPRTFGDTAIHISQVDWLVETDAALPELGEIPFTPVEEAIGENVAELIGDGDCIQLGIGGTSNVVARKLVDKRDLGIHSEMFTDSMMELMKRGVINNSRKNINTGLAVASFAWGSRALYDFIDGNRDILFKRSTYVNDPFIIAQNDNMVSINTTLQVDLTGQVCSESIGPRQYSGTGGAFDFAYGALHAKGGRGIVAVPSTAKKGTVSRIAPLLTEGAMVSITRNVVDNIVTEYGVAPMRGRTVRQRVRNLIAVAHPDFREELEKQARYLMLW